jgi:hypothetical protein
MAYTAELKSRLQVKGWLDSPSSDDWASIRDNAVLNLRHAVDNPPKPPTGSIQEWWDELLISRNGVAPPNPFVKAPESEAHQAESHKTERG